MTCYHDVSAPLRHLQFLFELNLSFTPLSCALYPLAKFGFFFFFDWLKCSNPSWAPQHGNQWRHFARALAKCATLSLSLALHARHSEQHSIGLTEQSTYIKRPACRNIYIPENESKPDTKC